MRADPGITPEGATRLHLAAAGALFSAVAFLVFFQVGKVNPFAEINPFGADPYDAVGSIAVQIALFCALLSYGRALRVRGAPAEARKAPLVIRGSVVVLASILTTVFTDAIAEVSSAVVSTPWGSVLRLGLTALGLLALACAVLIARAASLLSLLNPPTNLTPADAIDDLWALFRIPLRPLTAVLPSFLHRGLQEFTSDRLFAPLPSLNPRFHPWRFATLTGLSAGFLLLAFQLREGIPPDLASGLTVAALFMSVELAATLAAFALFGRYLGLRPSGP